MFLQVAVRVRNLHGVKRGKEVPRVDSATTTAGTGTSMFQNGLARGRTKVAWRGNCTVCPCTTATGGLSSFGERPPTSPQLNFPRNNVDLPPGLQHSPPRLVREAHQGQGTARNTQGEASKEEQDVSTRSEKWLPPLPKCEILGIASCFQSLKSCVTLASDTFGWELESALG